MSVKRKNQLGVLLVLQNYPFDDFQTKTYIFLQASRFLILADSEQ